MCVFVRVRFLTRRSIALLMKNLIIQLKPPEGSENKKIQRISTVKMGCMIHFMVLFPLTKTMNKKKVKK